MFPENYNLRCFHHSYKFGTFRDYLTKVSSDALLKIKGLIKIDVLVIRFDKESGLKH